ncbi:protein DEEPER ROOTING 1-like [Telopea speciosissima]|uniref:protein DEEPER ROOTING 1-like n=1 Tax=Telopea speciosissima TaxID=54955 RepID=UPI001CC6878F|nr:protein DEEPER ROOTING 1-like [Telopea speciosissima]
MKIFFNWMQTKLSGRAGSSNKPSGVSVNHQIRQEPPNEEFSDWPHGLLAIGTFGNNNLKEESESDNTQEDPSSSLELLEDFTPEEVGKLQKELTKLLSRKPVSNNESESTGESSNNLPLDKFLNCPSSLEVDRTNCTKFCDDLDDKDLPYQEHITSTTTVVLSKDKGTCLDSNTNNANAIKKRSVTFLLKKMFACRSGFAPAPTFTPCLRDPIPESRMEKLLRAILQKKIYPQSSTPTASMKKYLENRHMVGQDRKEDDLPEKAKDGSKWVKTDSEYIVLEI